MLLPDELPALNLPKPGEPVTLLYPHRNRHGRGISLTKRRVLALELIDGAVQPIELGAFLRRPRIRRGRWRLVAWDPQRLAQRTFYLDWHSPTKLQLGRYSHQDPTHYEPIGDPFAQTREGIEELVGLITELLKEPAAVGDATLGLFAAA